jgi:phosphinothricin acetyltransferase
MLVRAAAESDWPAIVALYNAYATGSSCTFDVAPFTVETRRPWLEQFGASGRYRLLVAIEANRLVGYAGSMRYRPKPAYETSVELTCYVAQDAQRRGVATALYESLFEQLRGEDLHRALAGITLPNDASVALHVRFGFRNVGVFTEQGRKFGRYWDVLWMEKPLGG